MNAIQKTKFRSVLTTAADHVFAAKVILQVTRPDEDSPEYKNLLRLEAIALELLAIAELDQSSNESI